jgi:hypothetical protein
MILSAMLLSLSQTTAPPLQARSLAARTLESALDSSESGYSPQARAEVLAAAACEAAELLGDSSRNAARLRAIATKRPVDAARLERELPWLAIDLPFQPEIESPRPAGFPEATPVGEIAVLEFPACRLARVPMARLPLSSSGAFWKLFRHIESNGISMTAPVETTYGGSGERATTMAFLYGAPEIGRTGRHGEVEVVDVGPLRVVSLGLRGRRDEDSVRAAEKTLRGWLESEARFEPDGSLRVMSWNSPMVSQERNYFEVQIPVRARATQAKSEVPAR